MTERDHGFGGRGARWLAPAALFIAAVAIRALPWRTVFVGDAVLLFDHDAYYHLRRIVWSVVHFPRVLDFDPYLNFPEGARAIWTPCFDWLVALLALPFAEPQQLGSIERVAVWVPPLLGGATVVALHALARRHFDAGTALLAGALLAVLSGHFWYSQLGFVDHHAAEALTATWLLAATMNLLDREARAQSLRLAVVVQGLALAAALLLWPGSLLYAAIAEAGLVAAWLAHAGAARAIAFARAFAGVQLVALAALLPLAAAAGPTPFGPWSPLVLSRFQPFAFAALAAIGAACALLWQRRPSLAATPQLRAACVGVAALAVVAPMLPEILPGAGDAWSWLGRRESFQAQVAESQPLLLDASGSAIDIGVAAARLSWFAFVSPLALLAAALWAWRRPARASLLLWVAWTAALLVVTLLQRRFFNSFSVCLALLFAWSACALRGWIARALADRDSARRAATALLAAAVLACLVPVAESYRLPVAALFDDAARGPVHVAPSLVRRRAMLELAIWMSRRTPATAGWLDPTRRPGYGVLAPWEIGHILQYVARRPSVVDNFGDDLGEAGFERARAYFASEEPAASQILDELGARYVVAQREPPFLGPVPDERSMFASLYYFDGSASPAGEGSLASLQVPALERHRLVYESTLQLAVAPDAPAFYKVFEHVAGARVEGLAPPHTSVEARLGLRTNRGRELVIRTSTRADAQGRYRLRLPYSNRGEPPSVRTAPAWELACENEQATLVVEEVQVRSGGSLAGPRLCLGRDAAEPGARPAGDAAGLR
jgi:dolichyl-diphosphooligosaccharide--protein glycosyltransferase